MSHSAQDVSQGHTLFSPDNYFILAFNGVVLKYKETATMERSMSTRIVVDIFTRILIPLEEGRLC